MLKCVTLGAYGWAPLDWVMQYYPTDLPEDWQSAYYANEFRAVLLPEVIWQAHGDDLADALQALPEGFKCVFELSASEAGRGDVDEQIRVAWQTLNETVQAVISEPELLVPPTLSDSLLAQLQQHTICHRLSADGFLSEPAGTDYQLAVVKAEEPLTPLAIKAVVEQLKNNVEESVTDNEVYVFLDTPYQTLTNMQAMLELYGL